MEEQRQQQSKQNFKGTIIKKPVERFNAEKEASALRAAMKGFGTDEDTIIRVLSEHDIEQRTAIRLKYSSIFGRDLYTDFKNDLGGNFLRLCLYMALPEDEFDARCLRYVLNHGPTETLTDILVTRSNEQIHSITAKYKELFKQELPKDLEEHLSSFTHLKRVLIALAQGDRSEDMHVDQEQVVEDVSNLIKAGTIRLGTDEDVFTKILVSRSRAHLLAVFRNYQKRDMNIEEALDEEMSLETKRAFLAIVRCVRDPVSYFAQCFHEAFKGPGTDDERLMQILVSRSELDLLDIAEKYHEVYGQTLQDDIISETSGDYRKLLVKVLDRADEIARDAEINAAADEA